MFTISISVVPLPIRTLGQVHAQQGFNDFYTVLCGSWNPPRDPSLPDSRDERSRNGLSCPLLYHPASMSLCRGLADTEFGIDHDTKVSPILLFNCARLGLLF